MVTPNEIETRQTIGFLDSEKSAVETGESLLYQYVDQVFYAYVKNLITQNEFNERVNNLPEYPISDEGE